MASESMPMADLNKKSARRHSTFVEPRTIFQPSRPVPKNFKGCKCLIIRCQSKNCPCFKGEHRCTSWCKCQDCDNMYGLGGGGDGDSKQGCTCKLSRCVTKRCPCYKGSHKCTPRCRCENCANPQGSDSDTEPEQADDTSIRKPTQMDSGSSSPNKRLRIR